MSLLREVQSIRRHQQAEQLANDDALFALSESLKNHSQRSLAKHLGVSQSAIAQRLKGFVSDYDTNPYFTLRSMSEALAQQLQEDPSDLSSCLRLVAQAVSDFRSLRYPRDRRTFLRQPLSTGDPRWDVLVAAVAAREARKSGMDVPVWTEQPEFFLDRAWFVTKSPGLRALAFVESPADFSLRNVYLDPAELESV
jgi:transcriptional regulator with XRE-family HTH domain